MTVEVGWSGFFVGLCYTSYMTNAIVQSLSQDQLDIIQKDLRFIDLFTKAAKQLQARVIISGGYAVDGNLGIITRSHNDMDIQIYSKSDGGKTIITTLLQKIYKSHVSVEDKGREEYYHVYRIEKDEFIAEFYCIQVVSDPFGKEKILKNFVA